MRRFALSRDIRVQLRKVGHEAQPVMVVDNLLAEPEAMIDFARRAEFYVPSHTKYPGLNAALPDGYHQTVVTALRGAIEAGFGLPRDAWIRFFGFLALATTPAGEAEAVQKIPHYDTAAPGRLAMVHYLCHGDYGGTGFFRHKATGYESIDVAREAGYAAMARAELETASLDGYAGDGMAHFELTAGIEKVFNRLIVYRSQVLHSGLLNHAPLTADPATGRLTANGFIEAA